MYVSVGREFLLGQSVSIMYIPEAVRCETDKPAALAQMQFGARGYAPGCAPGERGGGRDQERFLLLKKKKKRLYYAIRYFTIQKCSHNNRSRAEQSNATNRSECCLTVKYCILHARQRRATPRHAK